MLNVTVHSKLSTLVRTWIPDHNIVPKSAEKQYNQLVQPIYSSLIHLRWARVTIAHQSIWQKNIFIKILYNVVLLGYNYLLSWRCGLHFVVCLWIITCVRIYPHIESYMVSFFLIRLYVWWPHYSYYFVEWQILIFNYVSFGTRNCSYMNGAEWNNVL